MPFINGKYSCDATSFDALSTSGIQCDYRIFCSFFYYLESIDFACQILSQKKKNYNAEFLVDPSDD